jgi:peptide/nickel transport system substrate-binding protein
MPSRRDVLKSSAAAAVTAAAPAVPALAQARGKAVTITTTGIMTSPNPYAHSSTYLYALWGQVYGACTRYNYIDKKLEGILCESWTPVEDKRWRMRLRSDLTRHDGGPGPTSRDVVHSWKRMTDAAAGSQQLHHWALVDKVEPVDDLTFDVITKQPHAQLASATLARFAITSADLYEKHGKDVDKVAPHGWGPYKLDRFDIDQRIVFRRHADWPRLPPQAPDTVVFQQILEPEQRVNALLSNQVQIARLIPPQLVDRLRNRADIKVVETGSLEYMFVAMNVNHKPWNDPRMRRAVAHAINRDLIIDRVLFGLAEKMEGAITKDQDCFAPAKTMPQYDPAKAKALIAEAGYPNGVDVDFYTAVGRYISDRQIAEVITQMLTQVGIRTKLHTPEYAALVADYQAGRCPFYYAGRGGSQDAMDALPQYFQTGVTKRTGYSNPEVDAGFAKVRSAFDPVEQCRLQQAVNDTLNQDSPAVFLWTHKLVHGVRRGVTWDAEADGEVWLPRVRVA